MQSCWNSAVAPKLVARTCFLSTNLGILQVKTSVGLQTVEGFAATAGFPKPNGATFTFFFFFCTMENWRMIQENTDNLRKFKGCKVFFHSGTIENRKTLITCQCPTAGGTLPRKVSVGINHNLGIVFSSPMCQNNPSHNHHLCTMLRTFQTWQKPGPSLNRTIPSQKETLLAASSKTQLELKGGNAGDRSAPQRLSGIDSL